jgi:RNA polymerase sigma-70 factor, ECF subfamily
MGSSTSDPRELIALVAGGSEAAFTSLYSAQQPAMVRYATGLLAGDRESAADAVDEAFLDIWRSASRFAGEGCAEGWIRHIVRNKAIDLIRRNRERLATSDHEVEAFEARADEADTPADQAETISMGNELRRHLERLSSEHREAVWLCYFEEKSLAEIATIMHCPENTVKTRLFHARRQLRSSLQERES